MTDVMRDKIAFTSAGETVELRKSMDILRTLNTKHRDMENLRDRITRGNFFVIVETLQIACGARSKQDKGAIEAMVVEGGLTPALRVLNAWLVWVNQGRMPKLEEDGRLFVDGEGNVVYEDDDDESTYDDPEDAPGNV